MLAVTSESTLATCAVSTVNWVSRTFAPCAANLTTTWNPGSIVMMVPLSPLYPQGNPLRSGADTMKAPASSPPWTTSKTLMSSEHGMTLLSRVMMTKRSRAMNSAQGGYCLATLHNGVFAVTLNDTAADVYAFEMTTLDAGSGDTAIWAPALIGSWADQMVAQISRTSPDPSGPRLPPDLEWVHASRA